MEDFDCKVPFCGFIATTLHGLTMHVSICDNSLNPVVKLSVVLEHREKRTYTSDKQRTLYVTPRRYKRRFLDNDFNQKKNLDSYAAQIAQTEELKTVNQIHLNKAFASTSSFQEERKHEKEVPLSELQVVLPKILDSSLSFSTILSPVNVLAAEDNKKCSCKTRDGAE